MHGGSVGTFRQGLDVYDPSTGVYVREWHPLHLPMRLLWLNTFVLIASSIALELARRQAIWQAALAPALRIPGIADDRRAFPWLPASVLLAFAFLAGQSFAWTSVFRSAAEYRNANSSFFYMLTGTHAVHITAGMIALIYALSLAWRRRGNDGERTSLSTSPHGTGTSCASCGSIFSRCSCWLPRARLRTTCQQ